MAFAEQEAIDLPGAKSRRGLHFFKQKPLPKEFERRNENRSVWQNFLVAIAALGGALALALYSGAAAEAGRVWVAGIAALSALAVAGWVALTIVPVLAKRSALRFLTFRTTYRLTREGIVYIAGIFVVALAAVNTGNNLLFMFLACLLAGILISGIFSRMVLSGVELRLELPEHIFAGKPVMALAEVVNRKQTLPSFSLRLVGLGSSKEAAGAEGAVGAGKSGSGFWKKLRGAGKNEGRKQSEGSTGEILKEAVYFPYIPRRQASQQNVEMLFPRRGLYRQDSIGLQTRFPFGFLEKTRVVSSDLHTVVYPAIEPTEEFHQVLPLVTGELESSLRGRGQDLYSIRAYQSSDSVRHMDWKASAKTGVLQIREFSREDERRVMLVLDPAVPAAAVSPAAVYERAVSVCASLAWHFYELNSVLGFRGAGFESRIGAAGEVIYDILGHLATTELMSGEAGDAASDALMEHLAENPGMFNIIVTSRPHGSMPTQLWSSSYVVFLGS